MAPDRVDDGLPLSLRLQPREVGLAVLVERPRSRAQAVIGADGEQAGVRVGPGALVGPFARLRPGARLGAEVAEFYLPVAELKDIALSFTPTGNLSTVGDPVLLAQALAQAHMAA